MEKENGMTWNHGLGLLRCPRKGRGYKSPGSRKAECLFSKLFHLMGKTTGENVRASVLTQIALLSAYGLHLAVINTKMTANYIAGNTQIKVGVLIINCTQLIFSWGFPGGLAVKNLPAMHET